MRITNLKRIDERNVECTFEYDGRRCTAIVNLLIDGDIRGLNLKGISPDERRHLYDAPEGIDFTRQLWRFFDGEELAVPIELQSSAGYAKATPSGSSCDKL
jgi:hypothetical protein